MNGNLQDLKHRMRAITSDELLKIVTVNSVDYRNEALDLARKELQRRGYSEAEVQTWGVQASEKRSMEGDTQLVRMRFLLVLVLTAVITFSIFAPVIYYSIVAYGIPASFFIIAGYLVWIILLRGASKRAYPFAIGFASAVLILLVAYATAVPKYIAMIVVESLCFWLLVTVIRAMAAKKRRP